MLHIVEISNIHGNLLLVDEKHIYDILDADSPNIFHPQTLEMCILSRVRLHAMVLEDGHLSIEMFFFESGSFLGARFKR